MRHNLTGTVNVAALAALGVLAVLPGAAAAAVTIGSNLDSTPTPDNVRVDGPATVSQRNLVSSHQAAGGLTSPINGVVVRWRVKSGFNSDPIELRVIRPGADAAQGSTGAGTSPTGDPVGDTTTSFALNPGLPIKAGDGIGLELGTGEQVNLHYESEPYVGDLNLWNPPLTDGAALREPSAVFYYQELLLQATIEPDADRDGLGDESQDPDGGHPAPPAAGRPPCTLLNANILNIRVGNVACL
jgi:hypothetical protein